MRRRHIDSAQTMRLYAGAPSVGVFLYKLDGYRASAFKSGGKVPLRSRNDNDFSVRYASIAKALEAMPKESVIDGEVVDAG